MTPLRSQISSAEYNIPTSGRLSGQTNNPTLAQTTLDTPEHHLPAQRKGKLLDTHNLKAKIRSHSLQRNSPCMKYPSTNYRQTCC